MTGLTYRKADLHIHTPASICYYDKSVTPEQIVDIALETGLEVIAITDHNTFEAVDAVRGIAREKGLCVFPGIELSTRSGHFIGLFDIDTTVNELRDILMLLQPDSSRWGDATAKLDIDTEELLKQVSMKGGVILASHIERWPSGILESGESSRTRINIMESPYLSGLEITVPGDRTTWNNGKMINYPRKYACIQGSDAHNLNEIGRRPVYIKMEECNLEALKSAFNDFSDRISFPDDIIENEITDK
ncbi:PHP domain-containing protein [Chloroflexota bacterium]